ncbi:hypothetical protein ACIQYL_20455 [Lysinibacillus xylanilyticus]|uniref:hypothetical protein n=1 Tax=Lysinibacillus xylanilyticus TaxID=582475 RepID=UPI00381183AC
MRLRKKVFTLVMVLTLLVTGVFGFSTDADANATANNSVQAKLFDESAYKEVDVKANPRKAQIIKDMANNIIADNQMILNYSNAKLDFDNAKILEIKGDKENFTSITLPIVGDQYSLLSNLSLVFDSNNKLVNYSETLITKSDDNKFVVSSYVDGNLIQEQFTDLDYVSNSELQRQLDHLTSSLAKSEEIQSRGIGDVALCLEIVLGVDLVIARLIASTCIASCPALPPICVACIGAVVAVGVANMNQIIACFDKK